MNKENLATYLNDHLAGSVAALELLEHLAAASDEPAHQQFVCDLREAIQADQEVLRRLMEPLEISESTTRQVGAWVMEKAARVKLKIDGPTNASIGRLEAFEALLLGISGKRSLWIALQAAIAPVDGFDFADLIRRAEQQIASVEVQRLAAARSAFQ